MKLIKTKIDDLILILPDVFPDQRGYFFESFQKEKFHILGIDAEFVQDNESMSGKGVLRGLHFQKPPFSQGKLVRVVRGSVLDVAVDLRKNSKTYGKWESSVLSADNKQMMWIPEGFAHGFLVLEDDSIFQYKCSNYYNKESECGIIWNDPDLKIEWGIENPVVSEKDLQGVFFKDLISPFQAK
jgi:dTDP-4-dehydrorhamnose 3,5-epimerase